MVQAKQSLVTRCGHPSYTGVRATLPHGGAACTGDVKVNAVSQGPALGRQWHLPSLWTFGGNLQ